MHTRLRLLDACKIIGERDEMVRELQSMLAIEREKLEQAAQMIEHYLSQYHDDYAYTLQKAIDLCRPSTSPTK